MFYAREFCFSPSEKVLPDAPDCSGEQCFSDCVVVFYHAEAEDAERQDKVVTKWIKNTKWIAGKFNTKTAVLHSFNHLSESKAPVDIVRTMVSLVRRRLEQVGFAVFETPFGFQNEWKIHVAGESMAKVFKAI